MSLIVTLGLGNNQRLATSGYGYSDIVPAEPVIPPVIVVGPGVGTGGRAIRMPPRRELGRQGTKFIIKTLLEKINNENVPPEIRGEIEKFFLMKVVRVAAGLDEHEEQEKEIRVIAHLWGVDWDA